MKKRDALLKSLPRPFAKCCNMRGGAQGGGGPGHNEVHKRSTKMYLGQKEPYRAVAFRLRQKKSGSLQCPSKCQNKAS